MKNITEKNKIIAEFLNLTSQVISPSKFGGVYNIHKIFRSTKNLAENKAKKYCEFLNK